MSSCSNLTIIQDRTDLRSCSFCMQDYEEGEARSQLNCSHIFHSDCLVDMRERASTIVANRCALCRERITSINGQPVNPIERIERNEEQIHEDQMLALQLQNQWQSSPQNTQSEQEIHNIFFRQSHLPWMIRTRNDFGILFGPQPQPEAARIFANEAENDDIYL